MIDYRAATRVHVARLADSPQARRSLILNLACMKGHLVKDECVTKYRPPQMPKETDLTKSPLYDEKDKYALTGVLNEDTGAYGYTSRSATQPFVNKGGQHFRDAFQSKNGLTFKQCADTLEALLDKDCALSEEAQFAAGQTILNFRRLYAAEAHWGHAEKVVMKTLAEHGLMSMAETEKLDASLMFEERNKNLLKRNTSLAGPWLHKLDTRLQEMRSGYDPAVVKDLNQREIADMKNLPIAHFKLNEKGNGFEDCSCANAVACINHARLMSGQQRLSKEEIIVIISCLHAVYDDTSSIRHTLHEVARGCFAGAGYPLEDADAFYSNVCRKAAQEYYGGRNLSDCGASVSWFARRCQNIRFRHILKVVSALQQGPHRLGGTSIAKDLDDIIVAELLAAAELQLSQRLRLSQQACTAWAAPAVPRILTISSLLSLWPQLNSSLASAFALFSRAGTARAAPILPRILMISSC
ncbi:hypothetical protein NKH71_32900 [Mesorhizobium sp. M0983]